MEIKFEVQEMKLLIFTNFENCGFTHDTLYELYFYFRFVNEQNYMLLRIRA